MSNYCFIVNPASGNGKGRIFGRRLEERLPQLKLDYRLDYTIKPWHACDLANKAADVFETIVVVGGDGTMHEVLNGMFGSSSRMGIIPVGTGNDFVRAVAIPVHFDRSLDILLRGDTRTIDIGKANERYYHNGLGIGFDAHVVNTALRNRWLRGKAIYLYSVLSTLLFYKPVNLNLEIDDMSYIQDYFMLTAGNGRALGGGFYLTPDALLDDGLLDLCIIQNMNKIAVIKNLLKVYSGRHKDDHRVDIVRTSSFRVTAETGVAVHADGELLGMNMRGVNVEIIPHSLRIVA